MFCHLFDLKVVEEMLTTMETIVVQDPILILA